MRRNLIILFLLISTTCAFAQAYKHRLQADSLQNLLKHGISRSDELKVLKRLVAIYDYINIDTSTLYATQALQILEKDEGNDLDKAFFLGSIGRINVLQGFYDKAMNNFLAAYKIAEKSNNPQYIIGLCINIATVYDRQKQYDMSLQQNSEALRLIEQYMRDDTIKYYYAANIFNNMASAFRAKRDTLQMITYYEKALNENANIDDRITRSVILNNLGKSYVEYREFDRGKKYILESLRLKEEMNDLTGIVQSYRNLGQYFAATGEFDSAISYYNVGLKLARSVQAKFEEVEMHEGLSKCYEIMGQPIKALEYYQKFKMLSDSLFNDDKLVQITKMKNTFEFEKQQANQRLLQKSKEMKLYISLGLLVALFFTTTFIVLLQRSRIKRSRLQNEHLKLQQKSLELEKTNLNLELEHKSKELTTTVMYMYRKNELIASIIEELNSIRANLKPENVSFFDKIVRGLDKLTEDKVWHEFEKRFNDVHHDFYKVLQDRFPDLTPNERKLCAFLKLNMTSKEISSITGQSIRGIDVARTRLRRKVNLTNSTVNLVDFLAGL